MTVFVSDSFARPDGPSLGNADTGQPWVAPGWGTVAGRGRKGGGEVNAVIAATGATGVYTASAATIPPASGDQLFGVLARYADAGNLILWERVLTNTEDAVKLYVRTGGGPFVERAVFGGPPGSTGIDPDALLDLSVRIDGRDVVAFVDGVQQAAYTLTLGEDAALTGTGAGMRDEGTPGYWASFVVQSAAVAPAAGWAPDYVTADELAVWVRIDDDADDLELALAATSASRAIDRHTHRQFGKVDEPQLRRYTPTWDPAAYAWVAKIDDLMDLASVSFTLAGQPLAEDAYTLGPLNAAEKGRPYTRLMVAGEVAPVAAGTVGALEGTAAWGWTAVPDAVKLAARLQAARFHKRRDAAFGIAGSPADGSEMRLLDRLDPDVAVSLNEYVRDRVRAL